MVVHFPQLLVNPVITTTEVLSALKIPTHLVMNDLAWSRGTQEAMTGTHNGRAMSVVEELHFQSWFKSPTSEIIVVCEDLQPFSSWDDDEPPRLTLLTAILIDTISSLGLPAPLFFFCAPHVREWDPLQGPLGMMKALLNQLLQQSADVKLPSLNHRITEQLSRSNDIQDFCDVFRAIVLDMPPTIIFCVIDGLSIFDNGVHSSDTALVVKFMRHLIAELNSDRPEFRKGPVFKLMVMMPNAGA